MWSQYKFLKTHKLGFNAKHIIYLPSNKEIRNNYDAFKSQILQSPKIRYVSKASWIPGYPQDIESYTWRDKFTQHSNSFYTLIVDPDYAKVLGLKFVAGRNFSREIPSDKDEGLIINEAAAKIIGWKPGSAIGKRLTSYYHPKGRVIGVVKDFNFKSLQHSIEPVLMLMGAPPSYYNTIAIKISSLNIPGTVNYIRSIWQKFSPEFPFDYHFLDQSFGMLYQPEEQLSQLFGSFSLLSILVACLGLFGLATYTVQERVKEIGVRKVLGASIKQIIGLIASDFIKLVIIANVIAWPIACYAMNKWLQSFAYRINISWWVFILSGGIALMIALTTVSFQAIKAATANPVKSLRYE